MQKYAYLRITTVRQRVTVAVAVGPISPDTSSTHKIQHHTGRYALVLKASRRNYKLKAVQIKTIV